jgi:hypothetical protein
MRVKALVAALCLLPTLCGCGGGGKGAGQGPLGLKAQELQEQATARHLQGGQLIPFTFVDPEGNLDHYGIGDMGDAAIWTGCYLAAESFRYAATGDIAAYQACRETLNAMRMLREVTGVPGLLARGFVPAYFGIAARGEYHYSQDGKWIWSGDVSSDQLDGIIFGYYVFYRLAASPADKEAVGREVSLLIGHVIENGMQIVDVDGAPTTWGHYEPWYVRDEEHMNALLILSHLKVAHHTTGEERFRAKYLQCINEEYALLAETSVVKWPLEEINHSDHNLQWLAYYPLLSLETDPVFYASYRRSLAAAWDFVGKEGQTLFNFAEEALVPGTGNLADGVKTLQDFPTDLRLFEVINSTRSDLEAYKPFLINPESGDPQIDFTRFPPLPVNERPLWEYEWAQNPYRLDGNVGRKGETEQSGVDYLLAYWMGRYHGLLSGGD